MKLPNKPRVKGTDVEIMSTSSTPLLVDIYPLPNQLPDSINASNPYTLLDVQQMWSNESSMDVLWQDVMHLTLFDSRYRIYVLFNMF